MTDDDITIADRLPDNFVDKLAEKAGGYRANIDLDWPEQASTAGTEVEDLIETWSPKTAEKLGLFTGQLKRLMDDVAEDAQAARDYIDEELG